MAEEYARYMARRWKESHCRKRKTALAPKDASVLVFDAAPHRRGASRIRDPRKGRGEKPALAAGSSAGDGIDPAASGANGFLAGRKGLGLA